MQGIYRGKIIHNQGFGRSLYNEEMEEEESSSSSSSTKIIGWREWASLPNLGLIAIKAKIDTGAKTSSLHAFDIHVKQSPGKKPYVHFKVHPLQNDQSFVVSCKALLIDQRIVTDSGGHKEERYVIKSWMSLGGTKKRIEITLTNRETMKYRMLIGRGALKQFYIDPSQSYLTGKTLKQKRFLKSMRVKPEKA